MKRFFPLRAAAPITAALLLAAPASATKYAGEFLKAPVGPRAIGMGAAFTAVTDDATAPYWNPAGMVYLPYREVMGMHAEKFGSLVNQDYLSGVLPLGGPAGRRLAVGVSMIRLAVDDIPITPRPEGLRPVTDFLDDNGNGTWDYGERLLLSSSDFFMASSNDVGVLLSVAMQRGAHWAWGGSLKFVRQSIPNDAAVYDTVSRRVTSVGHATSFGAGLDAGVLYMPTDAVTVGATLRDLTTTYLAWNNGTHELIVPTLDTGAAVNFFPADHHALTWALDLAWGFERRKLDSEIKIGGQTWDVRTGLEYWYRSTLALRAGVNGKELDFGAGVRYKQIGVDYAAALHRFFASDSPDFPKDKDLDTTHLVSLGWSW
ncbi:MAG TPA: hypothetical protein VGK89_06615 [Candidatus Eisenbacteria bacterium]|jgi:hypothetical protein